MTHSWNKFKSHTQSSCRLLLLLYSLFVIIFVGLILPWRWWFSQPFWWFLRLLLKVSYDTVTCYWLNPMRIRTIMERQGVHGPKPRFLTGNIIDMTSFVSREMKTINHDIIGRLLPHLILWRDGSENFKLWRIVFIYKFVIIIIL